MTPPYGDGRVYLRGRRYWIAYYAPVAGKTVQVRESAGKTEGEARKLLASRLDDVRLHREGRAPFTAPNATKLTVKRAIEDYLDDCETRGIRSYRPTAAHTRPIVRELGSVKLTALGSSVVARYVRKRREDGVTTATINRELEVLRSACRLAKRDGKIGWEPNVRPLGSRGEVVRSGFLTRAEIARLLDCIDDDDLRDFVAFFALTAMRPGEIASLRWSMLDEAHGVLLLEGRDAKTGDARVLPLVEEIAAIINRRKPGRLRSEFIFHNGGKPATRRNGGFSKGWYARWAKAVKAAGLPESTIVYDLRRSAIRALLDAGNDERTIMSISGHRTRRTFDRYTIVKTDRVAAALRSVAGFAARERGHNGANRERKA